MTSEQQSTNGVSQALPALQVTSAPETVVKYRRESTNQDEDHNSFVSLSSHTSTPFDSILATHATNLRAEVDNVKMNLCFHVKVKQEEFALITPNSIKQCAVLNKFTLATSLLSLLELSEKVCATISGCRLSDSVAHANASSVVKVDSPIKDPIKAIHESIKEIKNSHANEASRFLNLEKQLEEMKQCMAQLTKPLSNASTPDLLNPPPPAFPLHISRQPQRVQIREQTLSAMRNRKVDAIKSYTENFIDPDLSKELLTYLDGQKEEFEKNSENGHQVLSYGQPYKYVGAGAPAPMSPDFPDTIAKVADKLKSRYPDCVINQCLINRYLDEGSFLAEHADDENSIVHGSDIFTVSVGSTCDVKFRNVHDPDEEVVQKVSGNSLYVMSKLSQLSWKHRIDQSDDSRELRYSITFRLTHLNEKAKLFNQVLFDYINNCNPRVGSLDFNGYVDDNNLLVDNSGQTCANVKKKVTTHYNYSNSNLDKLCEEIEKDIDRMHSECDTFESFLEFFQEKIDTTCKLLTPRTSKRNSIVNPWITEGLINSIEKKARLYFDWRKTCSLTLPDGNDSLHVKYKEFSKVLKNLIKVAKTVYYSNKFEKYNKNSKKTWEIINELRGKTKMLVKDDFIIDGQRIANRRIIANKFNEYFTSLASNLNEQILSNDYVTIDPINSFVQYLSTSVNSSIFLEDTTPLEIVEIITNLKNGKASDIPIIVLKRPAKLLSTILAQLYNNCMQSGIFPSIFKVFSKMNNLDLERGILHPMLSINLFTLSQTHWLMESTSWESLSI
ncbi:hypothetical protein ACHWQZ_G017150 [Mnemiopsis leidyi]